MKFNYEFYKNTFGGGLTENEFKLYSAAAQDIISILTCMDAARLLEDSDEAILRALCFETDHLSETSCGERTGEVKQESLGDWSVTYADGGSGSLNGSKSVCGISVAPAALSALTAGGYLTIWI